MCPDCFEDRIMKNISVKTRQIIYILTLVFIQFIIISIWSISRSGDLLGNVTFHLYIIQSLFYSQYLYHFQS